MNLRTSHINLCKQGVILMAFFVVLAPGVFAVPDYTEPVSIASKGVQGIESSLDMPISGVLQVDKLVINEIDYDQPGTDTAEFIEIKNVSGTSVNLDSYLIVLVNGNNDSIYNTIDLPDVDMADGDYYVICSNAATTPNCDLDVNPDTNLIQNGSPDAVAIMFGQTVVDTVSYKGDTVAPYTEGSGFGLGDNPSVDSIGISRYPDGVDTDQNNLDLSMRCVTPGWTNTEINTDCNCQFILYYLDNDGDGYGDPDVSQVVCMPPNGYVEDNTDCDDDDPAINPGMTEIPDNGKDDDCNPGTPDSLMGDINNDDIIDISDVILVLRIALQLDPLKPCSDINNDGVVDISDVILTLRMALGLDPLKECSG